MADENWSFEKMLEECGLSHLLPHVRHAQSGTGVKPEKWTKEKTEEVFAALENAHKKIAEQKETIDQLSSPHLEHAPVILSGKNADKSASSVLIVHGGRVVEVLAPKDKRIVAGDIVKISPKTMQIVDVVESPGLGDAVTVKRVIDTFLSEVEWGGRTRVVANGKFANQLEDGDRVLVDNSGSIILSRLALEGERHKFTEETNVTWNDIGGLAKTKERLIEAIEFPYKHKSHFEFYNKKPPRGILLYGPPGCGKTLLAKAAASGLASIHKELGASPAFFYLKGPDILDRYVGSAEAAIRQVFAAARSASKKLGYTVIIFLDECDAILYKRGTGKSSDIERTIVPAFLSEMGGFDTGDVLVLLATNRPDVLDSAVTRDGRVDIKIEAERPDIIATEEIFKIYFGKTKLHGGVSVEEMAKFAASELLSDKYGLYEFELGGAKKGETRKFTLTHIINGAMINGIVDKTTSIALQRDIKRETPPTTEERGVRKEDVVEACEMTRKENVHLNHEEELAHFTKNYLGDVDEVLHIRQLRQTMA